MAKLSLVMDYYYKEMYPYLKPLEEKRLRSIAKLKKIAFVLCVLGLVFSSALIKSGFFSFTQAFLLSGAIGGILFLIFYRNEKAGYDTLFKDHVIEKIIHFINPSLRYEKEKYIPKHVYEYSGLFPQKSDRYQGSDLVIGKIEGVDISFSDLHVEEKRTEKNNKEEWHTLFQGLFFCADFHKTFHGRVYVLPDVAERTLGTFGVWLQKMHRTHGELVKLDHTGFEKYFVVYGTNQIETRYILSHAFMERIVSFREKLGKNLSLGFVEGKMYLALEYPKALFSSNLNASLLTFRYIKSYVELLEMIFGIVESLALDKKLWSKYE